MSRPGSLQCGAQPFPEHLLLAAADSFSNQYRTQDFAISANGVIVLRPRAVATAHSSTTPADPHGIAFPPAAGTITLVKSGHCISATAATQGAAINVGPCKHEDDLPRLTTTWKNAGQSGYELLGPSGAASGLCIGVSSHIGGAGHPDSFTIDRPFTNLLDPTSHITILPFTGQIAFNSNDYSDGGEVQFYSTALGVQAMENKFSRTGGLTSWARIGSKSGNQSNGWGANFRNSFIDNEVTEGNHVWNYATKPTPAEDPALVDYFPGGSKTIEPWFFGSLTNDQGPPVDPAGPSLDPDLALNRFIVFRGTTVRSKRPPDTMALIISDCDAMRSSSIRWP